MYIGTVSYFTIVCPRNITSSMSTLMYMYNYFRFEREKLHMLVYNIS